MRLCPYKVTSASECTAGAINAANTMLYYCAKEEVIIKCKQYLFSQLLGGCKTDRLHMYAPTVLLAAQNLQGHNTTNPTLLTEGTGSWDA